ncbi:MAG: elongation factor G [Candidatus Bipolaricaulota bacterium]
MSSPRLPALETVRNIGIMAHIDAGKTTTTERILFYTGQIHKMGEVHEGDTEMDWMPQERERGITITSAATTCPWDGHRINLIDTPGHVDFTAEVERSLRVLDGGVVVFSGVEMVESQSETVWRQADRYGTPRLAFVNKLDRAESSLTGTLEMIEERLGVKAVPLVLPHRDADRKLVGLVDLLARELVVWDASTFGVRMERQPMPQELRDQVEFYRELAMERVAEVDDRVAAAYLEGRPVAAADFHQGLRKGCIEHGLIPLVGGSAFQNVGIQLLLDAIVRYLPSPRDIPAVRGVDGSERPANPDAPLSALAFKVQSDPYAGRLVYVRIYSGKMSAGGHAYNSTSGKGLRVTKLFRMHANRRTPLEEADAGDIVAVVGSQDISTGDTLCDKAAPILLESISFPDPVVFTAVEPRTEAELPDLMEGLEKLAQEDPTFHVHIDETTDQIIMGGMGELHLEVLVRRLREELRVHANVGTPQVAYRETLREPLVVEEHFVRQVGGRGQYAHVVLRLEPLERGRGLETRFDVAPEEIPPTYRAAVESALRGTLTNGPVAGYPLADIGATVIGGSFHPVDSSELAFRAATSSALHKAYGAGAFELLEPIMEGEVVTPAEYLGEVLEDLARRRGEVQSMRALETAQILAVSLPLAETFGYATRLRSLSQGRAAYSLRVARYDVVPEGLREKIVKSRGY